MNRRSTRSRRSSSWLLVSSLVASTALPTAAGLAARVMAAEPIAIERGPELEGLNLGPAESESIDDAVARRLARAGSSAVIELAQEPAGGGEGANEPATQSTIELTPELVALRDKLRRVLTMY